MKRLTAIWLSTVISISAMAAHAETFNLVPGWNLLGTVASIPTSEILRNSSVKNVVIFKNGAYQASNRNEFSIIPEKSGFFVFSESDTTISFATTDTSINLAKLDGNGNELPSDAGSWNILHIKDANLLVEMKNDFTVGQKFSINNLDFGEAAAYCNDLSVGNISGWRLPTIAELTGVSSVYQRYSEHFTTVSSNAYWSSSRSGSSGKYAKITEPWSGYDSGSSSSLAVICVKGSF